MPPHFVPFRETHSLLFTRRTAHRSLSAPTYRPGIGSSLDIHHSMSAALSERRNRQRKRRQKDDFSTSTRHGGVESFSSPCDASNSYNENSNQAFENPSFSSYFIPGISGKARCLRNAALPYLAKPERDSQIIGAGSGCLENIDIAMNTSKRINHSIGTNSTRTFSMTESRKRSKHCKSTTVCQQRHANDSIQCRLRRSLSQVQTMSSTNSVSNSVERTTRSDPVTVRDWNDGGSCCSTRSMLLRNQLASVRSMLNENSSSRRIK
jgi:hypothetical protein